MKRLFISCFMVPIMCGCSLMNTGPSNEKPRPPTDWERMAPTIQLRVKYVATFAFIMDAVKPHKAAVCQFADELGTFLDSYDDHNVSFEKLQAAVMAFINRIQDLGVRNAVTIITDMVLTEAFNYAWQHYEDFITNNQTIVALVVAGAVADGLRGACELTISLLGHDGGSYAYNVFTIPEK